MPSLAELQRDISAGLRGGATPRGLTAPRPGETERRFAVYRNNVTVSLTEALSRRFPVIVRLVGDEFAAALFREFIRLSPPSSPLMMQYGAEMPGFLESFPPVQALAYLPDVARLELARGRAWHSADTPAAGPQALAEATEADPQAVRFAVHPSVWVLASGFPVWSVWKSNQPGTDSFSIDVSKPEAVFVARSGFDILTFPVSPSEAGFIAALGEGESLARAAETAAGQDPEFDPVPPLARLFRYGLVTGASLELPLKTTEPNP